MTTIKIDEYTFSVDVEKTREYYETHSLCDCASCRNFYAQDAQAREKLPEPIKATAPSKLKRFFGKIFG